MLSQNTINLIPVRPFSLLTMSRDVMIFKDKHIIHLPEGD